MLDKLNCWLGLHDWFYKSSKRAIENWVKINSFSSPKLDVRTCWDCGKRESIVPDDFETIIDYVIDSQWKKTKVK